MTHKKIELKGAELEQFIRGLMAIAVEVAGKGLPVNEALDTAAGAFMKIVTNPVLIVDDTRGDDTPRLSSAQ
jgi:hypothetical protein